ncbi:hypothetical protein J1785_07270 [Rahnella sp. SL6]|uniref:hypothetical protein n=1 Tax=Rahnella perminowiae TaxID=2816244 RepID=UPI001C251D73|nr:hypothetical protein [Rahnella perminowiae]MBU9809546.1 hypothetical protein [Rahnella perminowiae]
MAFQQQVGTESRVEIYQFCMYDITSDELITSKRWATLGTIEYIKASAIRKTATLVNKSDIDADGFTVIGYTPQ